jgi:hypothetical protein
MGVIENNGRRIQYADGDHNLGNAILYEPQNRLLTIRQIAGAWLIALSIGGLALALMSSRMETGMTATAAPTHLAASAVDRSPMRGAKLPSSTFYGTIRGQVGGRAVDEADCDEAKHPREGDC